MNRIVKIQSNEGGTFTSNNNRVSFDMPDGKYYDLSKSYINFIMTVPVEANKGIVQPLMGMALDSGATTDRNHWHPNSALVRHVKFSNEAGLVENIQRCDILSSNLKNYEMDDDGVQGGMYQNLFQVADPSGSIGGLFSEQHKEGAVVSRQLDRQPVKVKCSDLMNFWKNKQYNANKYGRSRLEVEMNLQRLVPAQALGATKQGGGGAAFDPDSLKQWEDNGKKNNHFRDLSATFGNDNFTVKKIQISADGTTSNVFNRLEDQNKFWVGQQITIKGTATNAAPVVTDLATGVVRTIIAIEYDRGDGVGMKDVDPTVSVPKNSVTLTLDTGLVTSALTGAMTVTGIQCVGVDATISEPIVDFAELVLEEIATPDMDGASAPVSYTTFSTEEFDTPMTKNFHRMFYAEPEAITLYITSPSSGINGDDGSILSLQKNFHNYRLRIDNKDTSSRSIELRIGDGTNSVRTNDSLHLHKQMTALANSGKRTRNLLEKVLTTGGDPDKVGVYNGSGEPVSQSDSIFLIGQVLPRTQREKQVQVVINSPTASGVQRLVLFKELERVI